MAAGKQWAIGHPITTAVGLQVSEMTGFAAYLKQQQDDALAARDSVTDFVNQQKQDAISAAQDGVGDIADGIDKYSSDVVGAAFGVDVPNFTHGAIAQAAKDRLGKELALRAKGKDGSTLLGLGKDILSPASIAKAKAAKMTPAELNLLSNLPDKIIARKMRNRERQAKWRQTHKRLMGKWIEK